MKYNERGVGLVEVAVSIAILALVAVGLSLSSNQQKRANITLSTKDACQQIARNVATNIKAYDNDLTVRNWIPGVSNSNNDTPSINDRDPLCSTSRTRGVCAEMELLTGTGTGATTTDFYNFLNRRNAATWAYMVYNLAKGGNPNFTTSPDPSGAVSACSIYLADFDPQYLPSPVTKANLSMGYETLLTLKVTQSGVIPAQCNQARLAPGAQAYFGISVGVYVKSPNATNWEFSCAAQTSVGYRRDDEKANLTVEFKNLDNVPLNPVRVGLGRSPATPYNLCLDPAGQPYGWADWPTSRGLIADLTASEPGAFFRCEASLSNNPTPGLRKCTSAKIRLTDASGAQVFDGDFDWLNPTELYNKRPRARAQWGGKPIPTPAARPPLPYATPFVLANRPVFQVSFEATDVGRNQTKSGTYYFALEASCPPTNTYCPNAAPLNDGCGGTCPQGTMNGTNTPPICPNPKLFCNYLRPCDTCELTSCPGTRGQPQRIGPKDPAQYLDPNGFDCPPTDTYYPCEHRYDYCGAVCQPGTKAVPGPNPDDYCDDRDLSDLCGRPYRGTVPCGASPAPNPMPANPVVNQCPNPSTYCGTTVSGSLPPNPGGTQLYNYDRTPCAAGTYNTTNALGACPALGDYCQGAGQFVRDSCGQDCPAGLPSPAVRAAGYCCLGCNSAGNPPSFKRATSCDTYRSDLGNVGSCSFVNNCYQYNPP